jgi:hypothetical protein
MRLALAALGVSWLVTACATTPPPTPPGDPLQAVRAQAATELSCPAHLLRAAALGDETVAPSGRPRYVEVVGCSLHVIYSANETGYVLTSPRHVEPAHAPDHVDVR